MMKRTWYILLAGLVTLSAAASWYGTTHPDLARARIWAAQSPVLSAAGTDPERLRKAAHGLAELMEFYASKQSTPEDAALMPSLYPVGWLTALADAEEARLRFIGSGSGADWQRYRKTIEVALDAYEQDLRTFAAGYRAAVPEHARDYSVLEGTVSRAHTLEVFDALLVGIDKTRAQHSARVRCITLRLCAPERIERLPAMEQESAPSVPATVQETLGLLQDGKQRAKPSALVSIRNSACAAGMPEPHVFAVYEGSQHPPIEFVGDLFLYPVGDMAGPFAQALSERGAQYMFMSVANHYQCPTVGSDYARIIATVNTYAALGLSAESADTVPLLYESVARAAVGTSSAHLFTNRSAGLDWLVEHIVHVGESVARTQGLQSFSPDFLFRSKSSFYSLFLAHNESVAGTHIPPLATPASTPLTAVKTWSDLKHTLSREQVVHDLRQYAALHRIATP